MPRRNERKVALTPEIATVETPKVLHEGRYRVYENPDGGIRIQYKRDDSDTEDHMEIPGPMLRLAKMAGEGNMSFPQFMKEAMKLRP